MKPTALLSLVLAALSVISGYLLSKASFVGRVGINFFYKEYKFLKTWWKGGLVVFAVLMLLLGIQSLVQRKASAKSAKIFHGIALGAALLGLYFTYNDFRHTTTHRLLGERFHLGAYLFWIGWMLISLFFLAQKKEVVEGPAAVQ